MPAITDQPMSAGAGPGSPRATARPAATTIPTTCVARTSAKTEILRATRPPPKSPAPHASAERRPKTTTDAGPNGPPSGIDQRGLFLRNIVGRHRRGELDDDVCGLVVAIGGRQ